MPQYHFNIRDGGQQDDARGNELPDVEAAATEAVRRLGSLLTEDPAILWRADVLSVVVTNTAGLTLFSVDATLSLAPATVGLRAKPRAAD